MKSNMGVFDRIARVFAALVIIALWYNGVISSTWGVVLMVLAGIFIATSFMGFCPLYLPFGFSTKRKESIDFSEILADGGSLIDVRTRTEFASGHIEGAINIPLDQLSVNLFQLPDKKQPVVVCCASGVRSSSAKKLLEENGYAHVYNGGSWSALQTRV